jgi:hypothetical protein
MRGEKDAVEKLDNGVWENANPMLKWFADPHLPTSGSELLDRAYRKPDTPTTVPSGKDIFKGGPLEGLFHPTAFTSGGGGGGGDALSTSVKTGMLAAFREWFSSVQSASGYQNASYEPGGPASTRSAAAIAASFGNKDYPRRFDSLLRFRQGASGFGVIGVGFGVVIAPAPSRILLSCVGEPSNRCA